MAETTNDGSWDDWVRPETVVLGAAAAAVAAVAGLGDAAPDTAADDGLAPDGLGAGAAPPHQDEDEAADELLGQQTRSVADHGVTLVNMGGVAQAQADLIESFNPDPD